MTHTDPLPSARAAEGPAVIIEGLWLVEFLELSEGLPPGTVHRQPRVADDGRTHRDLGTVVAVVTLTSAVLQSLTAWLQARQTRQTRQTPQTQRRTEQQTAAQGRGYIIEHRADGTVVITLPRLDGTDEPSSGTPAVPLQDLRAGLEQLLGDLGGGTGQR
ncbi:hypothetical protein [Streptomyces sp. NPDC051211]|uniref:hypothetical protein n=1 Tax=Streptomyces sp. NPDC051211 TaxID=3154643 RepID=UPI00345054C3